MITTKAKETWIRNGFALRRLNGKRPAFKGSFGKGDTPFEIINWKGNVGVITGKLSGIVCLDIDVHNGIDGGNNLKSYMNDHDIDNLPRTRAIESPTGGRHFYYKLPKSEYDSRFAPNHEDIVGVDFRNHGQFMVLEGSETEKGIYKVICEVDWNEIPECPEWILNLYRKEFVADTNTGEPTFIASKLAEWSKGVTSGNRNNWLTRQVGFLFRQNLPIDEVYKWAAIININFIQPPLDNEEIYAIINSVNRAEQLKRKGRI